MSLPQSALHLCTLLITLLYINQLSILLLAILATCTDFSYIFIYLYIYIFFVVLYIYIHILLYIFSLQQHKNTSLLDTVTITSLHSIPVSVNSYPYVIYVIYVCMSVLCCIVLYKCISYWMFKFPSGLIKYPSIYLSSKCFIIVTSLESHPVAHPHEEGDVLFQRFSRCRNALEMFR